MHDNIRCLYRHSRAPTLPPTIVACYMYSILLVLGLVINGLTPKSLGSGAGLVVARLRGRDLGCVIFDINRGGGRRARNNKGGRRPQLRATIFLARGEGVFSFNGGYTPTNCRQRRPQVNIATI